MKRSKPPIDVMASPAPEKTQESRPTSARATPEPKAGKSLSRSQDNLASTLRKKAAAEKALAGSKDQRFNTPKTVRLAPHQHSTPVRNAVSNHNLEKCGTPIQRAQSAQNISKGPNGTAKEKAIQVKKSASTHNISNKGAGPVKQRNMNSQHIMAYNAELLGKFETEKKSLENRISELIQVTESRKTEIEKYKFEVKNLKEQIPSEDVLEELELLRNENKVLKEKLSEVGISVEHSTDSEKLSALHKKSDAAAAETSSSMGHAESTDNIMSAGDFSYIENSNWDKVSQKSGESSSEVSVACLQDRISQMEESHYSTNEELQATLQELTDLQQAVNELSDDNERFADEKELLLASLCAQTMKLENCRLQIEHLKALLVNETTTGSGGANALHRSDKEQQLMDMLKAAQEEREEFLLKQMELMKSLEQQEIENKEQRDQIAELTAICRSLHSKNDGLTADKKSLESNVATLKEHGVRDAAELTRCRQQLDVERARAVQGAGGGDGGSSSSQDPLRALLETSRADKQQAEDRLTEVEQELAVVRSQVDSLKEQLENSADELQHLEKSKEEEVDTLHNKLTEIDGEKEELLQEVDSLKDHIDTLQRDCERYREEKKSQQGMIKKLEADIQQMHLINADLESNTAALRQRYVSEQQEWKQFQQDLQTAVMVANEFKLETQENLDKVLVDHTRYQERTQQLEDELLRTQDEVKRLRAAAASSASPCAATAAADSLRGKVLSTVDRELANLRPRCNSKDSLSVKNLIHSIEKQVKGTPPTSPTTASALSSRRSSVDSLPGDAETERRAGGSILKKTPGEHHLLHRRPHSVLYDSVTDDVKITSPMKASSGSSASSSAAAGMMEENSSPKKSGSILKTQMQPTMAALRRSSVSENDSAFVAGVRQDPLANLSKKMGGSKRNALLKWCQLKTASYNGIDITNFSSSWSDGLAFCALLHSYLPDKIPYSELSSHTQERNFTLAFSAAESVGIPSILKVRDMVAMERPDWQSVMTYVTSIYKRFECSNST